MIRQTQNFTGKYEEECSIFRSVHVRWLNPERSLSLQFFINSSASSPFQNKQHCLQIALAFGHRISKTCELK